MRQISQQLHEYLPKSVKSCQAVLCKAMYDFNATRRTKFHQAAEDVAIEFKEIANAALDFEDNRLTEELEKLKKMQSEVAGEGTKQLMEQVLVKVGQDEVNAVELVAVSTCADKKKVEEEIEARQKKMSDEQLELEKQKILIRQLRKFVREGCVGGDSQSSGQ